MRAWHKDFGVAKSSSIICQSIWSSIAIPGKVVFFLQKAATLRMCGDRGYVSLLFGLFLGVGFGLSFSVFSAVFSLSS